MGIYDTIMLILLGAAAFIGWRKGMVSQVASIVSLLASFIVAANFYDRVASSISAPEPWNRVAGFVVTYLGTSLVVWFFFKQIRRSVAAMKLGDFDRQLGSLLGLSKGIALVTIITLVAVNLLTPGPREAIAQSRSGDAVQKIVHWVEPVMPNRVQEFLANYIQQLDEVLGADQDPYGIGAQQAGEGYPYPNPNSGGPYPNSGGPFPPPDAYPPYAPRPSYGQHDPSPQPGYPSGQTQPHYIPARPDSESNHWRSSAGETGTRYE
jgi:uncharacterized membrane protein required for colicin V production